MLTQWPALYILHLLPAQITEPVANGRGQTSHVVD